MIRLFVALVIVSGLAVAAPIPKSLKSKPTVALAGSLWKSTSSIDKSNTVYVFLDDGVLQYKHSMESKDSTPGTWVLNDSELTIEINKYSIHTGTVEGDTITLKSKNKANLSWTTVLTRKEPVK